MATTPIFTRRRVSSGDQPVELRFVDMLLIVIATVVFVAVVLSVTSAFSPKPGPAPRIVTTTAPTAFVGQDYRLTLAARGDDGELRWRLVLGSLPAGLRLGPDGTISGSPLTRQDTRATVEVFDGTGRTDRREIAFGARPAGSAPAPAPRTPPRIPATTNLMFAVEGQNYRHTFTTDTGTPPYRWTIQGEPPKGLRFGPDGTLTGRPADIGTSTFTVGVTDAGGGKARQNVRIDVREGPKTTSERVWDWAKKVFRVLGWVVFVWLVLFGFGGERIPGLLDLIGAFAGGRRRNGR